MGENEEEGGMGEETHQYERGGFRSQNNSMKLDDVRVLYFTET